MSPFSRLRLRLGGPVFTINLLIGAYALYSYGQLIQNGLAGFVVVVLTIGLGVGTALAPWFRRHPRVASNILNGVGFVVLGVLVLERCTDWALPNGVYLLQHILFWFWMAATFWFASRPFEFED
jgi:hypothetical protein